MLRPMANLFAVADPDAGFLDRIEERLAASGEFALVWRPAPGWLAAQAPLPESEPDGDAVHSRGFAFVEGRDRLERGRDLAWLDRVADLADHAPHRLAELPGDFGFVRFRPDGSALGVRSCGGLAPFYLYRMDGGGLALGTLLNYFPRFIPARFRPDPLINASWELSLKFIDGRTFVEGVVILPRASHTELSPGEIPRTGIYWDPRPDVGDEPKPSPEHARELRNLLIETLSRDLDPQGRNLLCLSGGTDSSSLAALAAGTVGRGLSAWSLIPATEPERSHELSYIDPLLSRFAIEPAHKVEFTPEMHREWIAGAPGLPFQVVNTALCDLPRICTQQEVRVLLCGTFADEVCGQRVRMPDWIRHTSLRSLFADRPPPFGRQTYKAWVRQRLVDAVAGPSIPFPDELHAWARQEVEAEYRDWLRRQRSARARDRRPLKWLADLVAADGWVAMNWEGTTPIGVRRSLPFFNRELLEFTFRCHPGELLGPGPKRLLREALRDDVPARHLLRPVKQGWRTHVQTANWSPDAPLPEAAAAIVRPDWLPHAPAVSFNDGLVLAYAVRVAEYLDRAASEFEPQEVDKARAPV